MPSTLSLLRNHVPRPRRQRHRRRGVGRRVLRRCSGWARSSAGLLLEHFWWGSVFLVNVPVIALLLVVGPLVLPESRDPHPGPFDLASARAVARRDPARSSTALKTVATEGPTVGGRALAGGAASPRASVFVRRQRRLAHPLLDLAAVPRPSFSVSVTTNLLGVFALIGLLLLLPQYLQLVLGYSPLEAALWMLPGSVAGVTGALVATRLARRLTRPALVGLGLGSAATGLALVAVLGGLAGVVVGFALLGAGVALAETLTNDVILAAAPADRAGAASAISETGYELGGALGTAVLGSLAAAVFTARTGQETLGGALAHAGTLEPGPGDALVTASREAFVVGMQGAAALGAAVLALTAVGAWRLLPVVRRSDDPSSSFVA